MAAALGVSLVLLLLHAWHYAFLTDDAFISFRYAVNFSAGHGLVFNPGMGPVEGYTNFLWVLILAGFAYLGVPPESISHVLTLGFTVVLWGLVVGFSLRDRAAEESLWWVVVPAFLLAASRSVAVWSTSGLETRLFEVLVVAAVFRLVVEVERADEAGRRASVVSGLLFGLAALARPDATLMGFAAFAVSAGFLWQRGGWARLAKLAPGALVFLLIAGGHLVFRLSYYGDWLPNTYHAKVGGRTWWSVGLAYLGTFAIEYAVFLWIPLFVAAVIYYRRRRAAYVPALFAAVVLPHCLHVVAIGGDHFEYRPFDLYFPFAVLLLAAGAKELARTPIGRAGAAAYVAAVFAGLVILPFESHAQFPADRHRPGFPGFAWLGQDANAVRFMAPQRSWLSYVPGFRWLGDMYVRWLRLTTSHFVGLRAEDHASFALLAIEHGRAFRSLVEAGILPRDLHVATDCVGALPYYSGLRTFDRLGLTDRQVAHGEFRKRELLAHDKKATVEQARNAGVHLWSYHDVFFKWDLLDPEFLEHVDHARRKGHPISFAELPDGSYLLVLLLGDPGRWGGSGAPLEFWPATDTDAVGRLFAQALAGYTRALAEKPDDLELRAGLAHTLLLLGRVDEAVPHYERIVGANPDDLGARRTLAGLLRQRGDYAEATEQYIALLDLQPPDPALLSDLATLYRVQGREDEAIAHYWAALLLDPETAEAHLNLADMYAQRGQVEEEVHHLTQLIRADPKNTEALLQMARILEKTGNGLAALAFYEDVLRAQPDHSEALARAGELRRAFRGAEPDRIRRQPSNG